MNTDHDIFLLIFLPQNKSYFTSLAYSETSLGLYQTSMIELFSENI